MPDQPVRHSNLRCLMHPSGPARYHLCHEGDWTRAVFDTHDNQFILRAARPTSARALVFMLNALSKGWEVVAIPSRFNVTSAAIWGALPAPVFFELEDPSDEL